MSRTIDQQQVTHGACRYSQSHCALHNWVVVAAWFISSSLRVWLNESVEGLASLQHVIQCGAKLEWSDVHLFHKAHLTNATLHNVYGATESSTTMWTAPAAPLNQLREGATPAGRPHAGTSPQPLCVSASVCLSVSQPLYLSVSQSFCVSLNLSRSADSQVLAVSISLSLALSASRLYRHLFVYFE